MNKHNFVEIYTHQWSIYGGRAHAIHKCSKCHNQFTHRYHDESWEDAIKGAGIDINNCKGESHA